MSLWGDDPSFPQTFAVVRSIIGPTETIVNKKTRIEHASEDERDPRSRADGETCQQDRSRAWVTLLCLTRLPPLRQESSMAIREMLLPEFDQEMASTRKLLERVPENIPDYK